MPADAEASASAAPVAARPSRRRFAPLVRVALALAVGAASGFALSPLVTTYLRPWSSEAAAIRTALGARSPNDPVAAFYRGRGYAPLWTTGQALRPGADGALTLLRSAAQDGLDPSRFDPDELASDEAVAASGGPADLARADLALSDAVSRYAVALHTPAPRDRLAFVDPAVAMPPADQRAALEAISRIGALPTALTELHRMSPVYDDLRAALAAAPALEAPSLRRNLDRARALPSQLGPRYVLVNPAAQTLWLYERGQPALRMKVVVGKPTEQTPSMIGVIRYAVLSPYWNVPPDLARDSVAPAVLKEGPDYLASHHLQAMSDWSDSASVLDPSTVDWRAIATGAQTLRMRQTPGPDNMMGQLKFVLPNPLGIYLHDTPLKALFSGLRRADSSGCVRLADAAELGRALFGPALQNAANGAPEQRVDLVAPVPVYILYLTAQPDDAGRVAFLADIYHRDAR